MNRTPPPPVEVTVIDCPKRWTRWIELKDCLTCEYYLKHKITTQNRLYIYCKYIIPNGPHIYNTYKKAACPICRQIFSRWEPISQHINECFTEVVNKEIQRDYQIAKTATDKKRVCAAIYRLYHSYDLSPKIIAMELQISEAKVRNIIGNMFRSFCLNSDGCVFKEVLQLKGEKR